MGVHAPKVAAAEERYLTPSNMHNSHPHFSRRNELQEREVNTLDILYILSTMYNASAFSITIRYHFLEVAFQMFIFGGGVVC